MSREKDDEKDLAERGLPPVRGGRGTRAPRRALALLAILMRCLGQSLGITVSMGVLYGTMSAEAGYRVTGFVEGRPELFMGGLSAVFHLLAGLVLAGLALSLVRTLVIDRRGRRADG